jgi:hypothetical protein
MKHKPMLLCMCLAAVLIAACSRPETPRWAPNVERTDITPSEWTVGCFAIETMTDLLRAAGARPEFELTAGRAIVVEGRQWYGVEMKGSHRAYGRWTPIAASKIRLQVGSTGFDNLTYALSRSDDGLVGTYRLISDASPGSGPDVPVTLRKVPCVSASAR